MKRKVIYIATGIITLSILFGIIFLWKNPTKQLTQDIDNTAQKQNNPSDTYNQEPTQKQTAEPALEPISVPSPNEPLASTATPAPSEENPAPEFTLESAPESTPVPESTPEPAPQLTFESTSEPASELTSETTPELTPTVNPTPADTPAPSATPTPVPTPKPTPKSTPTPAPEPQKEINPAEVVFYTEAVKINLTEEDEAEIERLYQEMRNDPIYSDLKDWQIQALAGIQVTDRKAKEAPPFVSKYFTREERDKLVSYPYYGGEPKQTFEFVVKSNVQLNLKIIKSFILNII